MHADGPWVQRGGDSGLPHNRQPARKAHSHIDKRVRALQRALPRAYRRYKHVFTYSAFASGALAGAVMLTALLIVSVAATLLCGRLLSRTLLKGEQSSFTLELPPFRMPRVGRLIVRSVVDRTLFVLGRAAAVAAPAGLLLYALSNISIGGQSILAAAVDFLDPFARVFGLDGAILIAFMLGFPANEIVLPIAIMAYTASGSLEELPALCDMRALLIANGWSIKTAVCFVLFSVMHWPCSTTLLTIKRRREA